MEDCLFCKIAAGKFNTEFVYEDDQICAFSDIAPKAPVHILIIPKKHIATINDISDSDTELTGKLILTARNIAKELGFAEDGYRLQFNCNQHGGQEVYHIHLHLLGGKPLPQMQKA